MQMVANTLALWRSRFSRCSVDDAEGSHPASSIEAPVRAGFLPEAAVALIGIEACASSHHWSRSEDVPIEARLLGLNGLVPKQNSSGGKERLGNIITR